MISRRLCQTRILKLAREGLEESQDVLDLLFRDRHGLGIECRSRLLTTAKARKVTLMKRAWRVSVE